MGQYAEPLNRVLPHQSILIDTPPAQAGRFSGYAQPPGSR
jgi:hypothetical protein